MIIQLLWICLRCPGKMREPDGSSPVMLHGSIKESLSILRSLPDNAQHGHVARCSPLQGDLLPRMMYVCLCFMTGDYSLVQALKTCKG